MSAWVNTFIDFEILLHHVDGDADTVFKNVSLRDMISLEYAISVYDEGRGEKAYLAEQAVKKSSDEW